MKYLRKLAAPASAVVAAGALLTAGLPPEFAAVGATSIGQVVDGIIPERTRRAVVADVANRDRRSAAYEAFGASVAVTWQQANQLCTTKVTFNGWLSSLLLLFRTQRRFEEAMQALAASMPAVLLHGSDETQAAALEVLRTLAEKARGIGRIGKGGSPEIVRYMEAASLDIGDKVVAWRKSAQADLASPAGK